MKNYFFLKAKTCYKLIYVTMASSELNASASTVFVAGSAHMIFISPDKSCEKVFMCSVILTKKKNNKDTFICYFF